MRPTRFIKSLPCSDRTAGSRWFVRSTWVQMVHSNTIWVDFRTWNKRLFENHQSSTTSNLLICWALTKWITVCATVGVVFFLVLWKVSKLFKPLDTGGTCPTSFSQLLFLSLLAIIVASKLQTYNGMPWPTVSLNSFCRFSSCPSITVEGQAWTLRKTCPLLFLFSGCRAFVHHALWCIARFP